MFDVLGTGRNHSLELTVNPVESLVDVFSRHHRLLGFVETLLTNVQAKMDVNPRARGIAAQLELALSTMQLSSRQLGKDRRDESVLAQEFAVATLMEAAKMMGGPT